MPRKRKESDSDDVYESEAEEEEEEEEEEEDYSEEDVDKEEGAEETESSDEEEDELPRPRKKRQRQKVYDGDHPSSARRTNRGGYAHTKESRLKISEANKGNQPWNKGKNRSSDDKAKIGAGVRARNRLILLEKLKGWNMTEEDYNATKTKLKYIRERIRKQRLLNRKARAGGTTAVKPMKGVYSLPGKEADEGEASSGESEESSEYVEDEEEHEEEPFVAAASPTRVVAAKTSKQASPPKLALFSKDFQWTPHPFDAPDHTLSSGCPLGGPGGLICCASCTANYKGFMTSTFEDLERHKISKVAGEVEQLLGFMKTSTNRLEESVRATRRKPVPLDLRLSLHKK